VSNAIFLPDHLEQVRAIAMRGLTDDEMAGVFGIAPGLIQAWKKFYPTFRDAIDQGRTHADAKVVEALYKNATGYTIERDIVTKTGNVVSVQVPILAETAAQRFWLTNRSRHWSEKSHHEHSGKDGAPSIGVKTETKTDIVNSILNLIKPKEDPV
jgi:hypothetical protein